MTTSQAWMLIEISNYIKKGKELSSKARMNKDICESTRISVDADNMFEKAIGGIEALLTNESSSD